MQSQICLRECPSAIFNVMTFFSFLVMLFQVCFLFVVINSTPKYNACIGNTSCFYLLGKHYSLMDDVEFRSDPYQRVYQYIRRFDNGCQLDAFSYCQNVEGTKQDCVQLLLR